MNAQDWNARFAEGTEVCVTLDNGDPWFTTTRSEAWELGHGQPVVMLSGRSGSFALERVEAVVDMCSCLGKGRCGPCKQKRAGQHKGAAK